MTLLETLKKKYPDEPFENILHIRVFAPEALDDEAEVDVKIYWLGDKSRIYSLKIGQ